MKEVVIFVLSERQVDVCKTSDAALARLDMQFLSFKSRVHTE